MADGPIIYNLSLTNLSRHLVPKLYEILMVKKNPKKYRSNENYISNHEIKKSNLKSKMFKHS